MRRAITVLARSGLLIVAATAAMGSFAAKAPTDDRAAFITAWPDALQGRWSPDRRTEASLRKYILWPDLRAAYYSARLDETPTRELEDFMRMHASLAPIRRLRYRYISRLAAQGKWREFLNVYQEHYANARIASLDCHVLTARVDSTKPNDKDTVALARRLWLTGSSQNDNCTDAFTTLLDEGALSEGDVRERMMLALEQRNFSLARYLAKRLDDEDRELTSSWQQIHDHPQRVLDDNTAASLSNEQAIYALKRLALREPLIASARARTVLSARKIDDEVRSELQRYIAIATAQDHHPQALGMLRDLPGDATDQRALEWRARSAMRQDNWTEVLRAIGLMEPAAATSDRWRFWEAMALSITGQTDVADRLMRALAQERSFYGFLAADQSGAAYQFADADLDYVPAAFDALASAPEMLRARELHAVGQPARAQSEWRRAMRGRTDTDIRAAAALAHSWGWHAEAIAALGTVKAYDDLEIRYPLAYRDAIERHANNASVSATWVYGITRSESLFDRDVRSSAGAWGLMQLMPRTGRQVAATIGLPWSGIDTLKDADSNIALGTRYLASLHQRFEHKALATAAYNAGPHRVDKWLNAAQPMRADVWIETIAYDETRSYVQRVLSADVIFQWRMNGRHERLSVALTPVAPKQSAATLASRL